MGMSGLCCFLPLVHTRYGCVLSREATHTNFIIFGLARPGHENYDLPHPRRGR